jgi:ACS family hexuronate transporter-like MFS transporter
MRRLCELDGARLVQMANTAGRPVWWQYRWVVAVLLCLITTINYIDRIALSIAAPLIREEFSISISEYGAITSAFLLAYAIGQIFVGPIIDRLGSKRAFGLAVVVWSIAAMLHAVTRGFASLLTFRVLLGVGEAANFPAALKVVAEWFPRSERSLAVGIVTMGPGLGSVLAPPLVGGLILTGGWEFAFLVTGALGFVWLLAWWILFQQPEESSRVSESERRLILSERDQADTDAPEISTWNLLKRPVVLALLASRFVSDGAFYFFVFFLPTYLNTERGFDIASIAMFAWIPFLGADLGSLAGGWTGKRLMDKGMSLDAARKWVVWIGALLVPLALPAVSIDSTMVAIALIGGSMFFIQFKAAAHFAMPADLFPARDVGKVWGIFGAAGSLGGMFFTYLAGYLAEMGAYATVFLLVSLIHIISAAIITWLMPTIRQQELR